MQAARELAAHVGAAPACAALRVSRATFYRQREADAQPVKPTESLADARRSPRALSRDEQQAVLDMLHEPRFADRAPAAVYAQVLDEGRYFCSIRTMYRLLSRTQEARERRNQLRHPQYSKPELLATAPNQVWSWDITKLLGPAKWTYYYLYVIMDIHSRYVVGWMLASCENADLAQRLIREACDKHDIAVDQLTLHSDRGPAMKSHTVSQLLATLGVVKSHSRPHVSNDNPFSESQFKTLKYRPGFPARFASFDEAQAFCREFFAWYNDQHYHSSLGLLTPATVHFGQAEQTLAKRQQTLTAAYRQHPERFVRRPPRPAQPPAATWINPPTKQQNPNIDHSPITPSQLQATRH
jgi:putative transposase